MSWNLKRVPCSGHSPTWTIVGNQQKDFLIPEQVLGSTPTVIKVNLTVLSTVPGRGILTKRGVWFRSDVTRLLDYCHPKTLVDVARQKSPSSFFLGKGVLIKGD